jgi:hypothetical protein
VEEYAEEEERKSKPSAFTFNIGSGSLANTPGPIKHNHVSSSATSPVLQGLLGIGKGPTTFEGIMAELPKCIQIKACLEQFEYHRAWMRMPIFMQWLLQCSLFNFVLFFFFFFLSPKFTPLWIPIQSKLW